jgi:nitrogen regulatory protein P-II 1
MTMKEIKAIIQPFKLTNVIEALKQIEGLPGITVDEHVHGFGKTGGESGQRKITVDLVDYVQKAKLELVVPDKLVERVIRAIQENAHTGNPGDGKVFVYDVQEVVKIRTNERGETAI